MGRCGSGEQTQRKIAPIQAYPFTCGEHWEPPCEWAHASAGSQRELYENAQMHAQTAARWERYAGAGRRVVANSISRQAMVQTSSH
jgi:hypothetical protein